MATNENGTKPTLQLQKIKSKSFHKTLEMSVLKHSIPIGKTSNT